MLMKPNSVPDVENIEGEIEDSLHSFQIVEPKDVDQIVAHIMANSGYQAGKRLGNAVTKDPISNQFTRKQEQKWDWV